MSLPGAAIRYLAERGMSLDDIAGLADILHAQSAPAIETKEERRRRLDRERKSRIRADKSGHSAENADTDSSAEKADNSANRRTNADNSAASHVRDNLPRLVTTGVSSAAGDCASDWPQEHPGGIAKHLASLAGPGLADIAKSPGLITTAGEIVRWKQMGCSWSEDVVPTVAGRTLRPRPSPIASWTLLTADVLAAKARRERPIDVPEATGPPVGNFAAQRAADNAESTRRALEYLKANG